MAVVYKYHHACFRPGNALVSSRRRLAVLGVAAYAMAAYASAHKELRILAFGDSLTEGYYRVPSQQQPAFHPYTKRLQSLLHQNLPAPCKVVTEGVSGELVVPSMTQRLRAYLQRTQAAGQQFHWVLIFGGTNDLGLGQEAETIFNSLQQMYKAAHQHGAKVVAMTCMAPYLPEPGPPGEHAGTSLARHRLNTLIRNEVAKQQGGELYLFDCDKVLAPQRLGQQEAARCWSDALHLTPHGYDLFGHLLWNHVFQQQLHGSEAVGVLQPQDGHK
ncbi:SGNH hydrolase-type esterase domain-containing protein [Haematococcus lacustris]